MELLYVWIEDYKNIHHQGFNFSPKYRFEFKPTKYQDEANKNNVTEGELFQLDQNGNRISKESSTSNQDNSIYENFFEPSNKVKDAWKDRKDKSGNPIHLGTITNITAIIGANGAGKSNLLEFLLIEVQLYLCNIKSDFKLDYNFILIFKKENHIFIFKMIDIKILTNIDIEIWNKNYPDFKDNLNIFFSSQLNTNPDHVHKIFFQGSHSDKPNYYSMSTTSIIFNLSIPQSIEEYVSQELGRQLEFLTWNNANNLTLPFITPDFINIKINSEEISKMNGPSSVDSLIYNLQMAFHEFYKLIKKESLEDNLRILNVIRITKNYLISLLQNEKKATFNNFIGLFAKINQKRIDISEIKILLKDFFKPSVNMADFEKEIAKLNKDFEDSLIEFSNICNVQIHSDSVTVKVENLRKIFHLYENMKFTFFKFKWQGLSSGEENLLSLYSRFFSVFKTSIEFEMEDYKKTPLHPETNLVDYESILLLIDEGESGFHPEWQRKYLKYLIDFFPQIYPGKQIQIILTTHSPFLASDLPKENIIFLKKGEQGEIIESDKSDANGKCIVADGLKKDKTFGANIHTLLSDSFFLEKGLIGEFAKGKIQEVMKDLGDKSKSISENRKDEIEKVIAMIGEPIIKRKLEQLFEDRFQEDIVRMEKFYSNKLEELKRKKEDKK